MKPPSESSFWKARRSVAGRPQKGSGEETEGGGEGQKEGGEGARAMAWDDLSAIYMGLSENVGYIPNEIAI